MSKDLPNDPVRSNPPVQSKFDKSHGHGVPFTPVSHPGATAPLTGTKVAGHNENGHKYPTKSTLTLGKGEHK